MLDVNNILKEVVLVIAGANFCIEGQDSKETVVPRRWGV